MDDPTAPRPAAQQPAPLVFDDYAAPPHVHTESRWARLGNRIDGGYFGSHAARNHAVDFMMSEHGISVSADNATHQAADSDSVWEPIRILGAGAFGRVGLWSKVNSRGEGIDDIAIKQAN